MDPVNIDFVVPKGWSELNDGQLRYVFRLIADGFSSTEVKLLCLLHWSGTKVVGRQDDGSYLMKMGKVFFEVTSVALAEIIPELDWLGSLPVLPVRIPRIRRHVALPADFSGVPFESFIICDNIYQGYLITQNEDLLDQLGAVLYGKEMRFRPFERINIFYWFASLKDWMGRKYPNFLQQVDSASDGNLLGSHAASVEAAMNAQIRALTKGDVTKEAEVLALDTHRALTELDAQAREYKELNAKSKSK